jgi:hypothetical protein
MNLKYINLDGHLDPDGELQWRIFQYTENFSKTLISTC